MNLNTFLSKSKTALAKRWFELIVQSYPPETQRLLTKETNEFANPVGAAYSQGMNGILDELIKGFSPEGVSPHLDRIIRIRAVQDFTPSQAVSFIFFLKRIIREYLSDTQKDILPSPEDLAAFDAIVDELILCAFDVYARCREQLYEVKLMEFKNRTQRLLQRANLIVELPDVDLGSGSINNN